MKRQLFFISVVVLFQTLNWILPGTSRAQKIEGGFVHSLAICSDSTVRSWGANGVGQLGIGYNSNWSNIPVEVNSLTGTVAVSGGINHSLALKIDGTVWAWGYNIHGELGNGSNSDSNVPVQVSSLTGIIAIAAGGLYSLALKNDGTVWAWGYNDDGQLGNGTNTDSNVPLQVTTLTGITAIACGQDHSLALKNDSSVWAWGTNNEGELGNGTNDDSNVPVQVSFLTGILAIAGGTFHSLALKNDSIVWAWGRGWQGQLGNGNNTDSNVPVQVVSLTGLTAIGVGQYHSVALKNDSTVWAWGDNDQGQLGNGTNTQSNVPVQVSSLTDITAIAAGVGHCLALKNNGTLSSWGLNLLGQLGNGTNDESNVPVQVIGLCPVITSCNVAFYADGDSDGFGNFNDTIHACIPPPGYVLEGTDCDDSNSNIHPGAIEICNGMDDNCNGQIDEGALLTFYVDIDLDEYGNFNVDSLACYAPIGYVPNSTDCNDGDPNVHPGAIEIPGNNIDDDCDGFIDEFPTNIQNTNMLQSWSVFPNPASGNSFINYSLSTPATVTIDLYDVLGNKLQQLVNGDQQQGEHSVAFDIRKLANGVYVLHIRAGDQSAEQKITVIN